MIKSFLGKYFRRNYKRSYSQNGEDIIVAGIMKGLKKSKITYFDIGAYDAVNLSNTYFFYENGHRGVCIEPNYTLFKKLQSDRPNDIVLNIGIGTGKEKEATFYTMNPPTLSTFSEKEAEKMIREKSATLVEKKTVKLMSVNEIMRQYFKTTPDFVSIDVEGLDVEILKTFNFLLFRPKVFCIETLSFEIDGSGVKNKEIFEIMHKNGYEVYADTKINTIFVDSQKND